MLTRFRQFCALALVAVPLLSLAYAQNGPPPYVRQTVEATMTMLDSGGSEPIANFMASAMVPDQGRDAEALADRLRAMRAAARGLLADVGVEAEPNGVRIDLSGPAGAAHVRLAITPAGITEVTLVDP